MAASDVNCDSGDTMTNSESSTVPSSVTTSSSFNGDDFIDNTTRSLDDLNREHVSELTPFLVYLTLLMLCGLLGNSVVFVVYYRKFKVNPTRTYILAMSVCDLLTNAMALVAETTDAYFFYTFYSNWACKILKTGLNVLTLLSGFVLVVVALERQRLVCGRASRRQNQGKRERIALSICCSLAVVFSAPRAVLFGSNPNPQNGGVTCHVLSIYLGTPFPLSYNLTLGAVFVLTLAIMSVCYVRIALHLWRHKRRAERARKETDSACAEDNDKFDTDATTTESETNPNYGDIHLIPMSTPTPGFPETGTGNSARYTPPQEAPEPKQQSRRSEGAVKISVPTTSSTKCCGLGKQIPNRTTLMLFVLTVVFVLNYLPYLVVEIILFVRPDSAFWKTNRSLQKFLFRTFFLNSAVNPFVYSFCSARFRYECGRFVSKICQR